MKVVFLMTDHAKKRKDEYFSHLILSEEFYSAKSCSKNEVTDLKSTPSFKSIKSSHKSNIQYFKTKSDMYMVTEAKIQKNGKTINVVITLIDLLKENTSKVDGDFKKHMLKEEHRLRVASEKQPITIKKTIVGAPESEMLLEGQKKLLKRAILVNKNVSSPFHLKWSDLDTKRYSYSTEMLKKISKSMNKLEAFLENVSLTKHLSLEDIKENEKDRKLVEKMRNQCIDLNDHFIKMGFDIDFLVSNDGKRFFSLYLLKGINAQIKVDHLLNQNWRKMKSGHYDKLKLSFDLYSRSVGFDKEYDEAFNKLCKIYVLEQKEYIKSLELGKRDQVFESNFDFHINDLKMKMNFIKNTVILEDLDKVLTSLLAFRTKFNK